MSLDIDITPEAYEAVQAFRGSRTTGHTVILGIKVDPPQLVLDEAIPEGLPLEEVSAKMTQFNPKIILYLFERTHPDNRKSYPLVIICYFPPGLAPQVNVVYSNARMKIQSLTQIQSVWSVQKRFKLTNDSLQECFTSNKWT
jgi:hypothetical protein